MFLEFCNKLLHTVTVILACYKPANGAALEQLSSCWFPRESRAELPAPGGNAGDSLVASRCQKRGKRITLVQLWHSCRDKFQLNAPAECTKKFHGAGIKHTVWCRQLVLRSADKGSLVPVCQLAQSYFLLSLGDFSLLNYEFHSENFLSLLCF